MSDAFFAGFVLNCGLQATGRRSMSRRKRRIQSIL